VDVMDRCVAIENTAILLLRAFLHRNGPFGGGRSFETNVQLGRRDATANSPHIQ
jgi:hypothetical protein